MRACKCRRITTLATFMKQLPIVDELSFEAPLVAAEIALYTVDEEYGVQGLYFGVGDPDLDGQHWNFTRYLDHDDGVCTVKEPQAAVLYEGITSFKMSRTGLVCEFDATGAKDTRVRRLAIKYEADKACWDDMMRIAVVIFTDRPYFSMEYREIRKRHGLELQFLRSKQSALPAEAFQQR